MMHGTEDNSRPTILLVDDSPTALLRLQKSLEYAGFTVAGAKSGVDALQQFPTLHPDLILLDVMMPGMDGFETCLALRQLPEGDRTPIVMTTSLDDIQSINRAYEVGATDFVTKPINPVILAHRLRYMLRANRAFQELYKRKETLRTAHVELELRVMERTLELQRSTELLKHEVRERQRAEDELRDAHARLRSLIDNSPLAVVEWDNQFRVQRWSMQAEHMFGWRADEVLGKHPQDWRFIPDEEASMEMLLIDQAPHGPDPRHVTRNRMYKKDGTVIDVEWYTSVFRDESGSVVSILTLAQDITERKHAEQLKDELMSTVSHELRTPLTSLRGFTELMLKRDYPAQKQREFLSIIYNESVRLTNLLNDFLDLQRIESGRQAYHFEDLSLPVLLHESVAVFSGGKAQRPFHLILPPRLPAVRADRERLQQVLANLFSNAVKFSADGSAVTVGAHLRNDEAVLWVKDQGIGIPPEAMSKLFSKFFRVDNQDTRTIGGTGLGLALVKKIIEAHTGRVWVESTVGEGSTFFFTLPLAAAERHETLLL